MAIIVNAIAYVSLARLFGGVLHRAAINKFVALKPTVEAASFGLLGFPSARLAYLLGMKLASLWRLTDAPKISL